MSWHSPVFLLGGASSLEVGAVLPKMHDGKLRPCAFFSKKLLDAERNYTIGNFRLSRWHCKIDDIYWRDLYIIFWFISIIRTSSICSLPKIPDKCGGLSCLPGLTLTSPSSPVFKMPVLKPCSDHLTLLTHFQSSRILPRKTFCGALTLLQVTRMGAWL